MSRGILVQDDETTIDECGDYAGSTDAPAGRHEPTARKTQ